MLPKQPGRYVRQGLIGIYWQSLLPKTGKIVTLSDDAFVSCTGLEPISLVIFVRKAMRFPFHRHGFSSCLFARGLVGPTPILMSSLHALFFLGAGGLAHATLSVGGKM